MQTSSTVLGDITTSLDLGREAKPSSAESKIFSSQPTSQLRRGRHAIIMQLKTQTWTSDSHGLFDYESFNLITHTFKCACLHEAYHLVRLSEDVKLIPCVDFVSFSKSNPRAEVLLEIRWIHGSYCVCPPSCTSETQEASRVWLAVRRLPDRAVALTPGDVLKLGRLCLVLKELVSSEKDKTASHRLAHQEGDCETAVSPSESKSQQSMGDVADKENEPLSPCDLPKDAFIDHSNGSVELPTFKPSSSDRGGSAEPQVHANSSVPGPQACRVCLCEVNEGDSELFEDRGISRLLDEGLGNPLIAPCSCKGSMKWIHLQCLRRWMAGRLNIHAESTYYHWRTLECELCKTEYPRFLDLTVQRQTSAGSPAACAKLRDHSVVSKTPTFGLPYPKKPLPMFGFCEGSRVGVVPNRLCLFPLPEPPVPYAVFAEASHPNEPSRGYFVVGLSDQTAVRIGRSQDAEIHLADISVSRVHATLQFRPGPALKRMHHPLSIISSFGHGLPWNSCLTFGSLFVGDNRSKFGTLLQLRKPFRLVLNFPQMSFQVNRTVITIFLRKRWKFNFPACLRRNATEVADVCRNTDVRSCASSPRLATASDLSPLRSSHRYFGISDEGGETMTHRATVTRH